MRLRSINWIFALVFLTAFPLLAAEPNEPFTAITVKTKSDPQAKIAAWFLPADGRAQGTVFCAHGFRNNKQLLVPYQWIRDDLNWNMVMFDFRNHGESSRTGIPTLGYNEQWDVKAMIDWAEANHLAKPYVCLGISMGASISLRWAGQDPRIAGVIAYSPYKSGWDAVHQFHYHGHSLGVLPSLLMRGGFKRMLQDVDIPEAVSKRDDLRIWIAVGERDWFPVTDEQAILDASASPKFMKRLEVIPGAGHAQQYKWRKNDQFIRDFLNESRGVTAGAADDRSAEGIAIGVGIAILVLIGLRYARRTHACH